MLSLSLHLQNPPSFISLVLLSPQSWVLWNPFPTTVSKTAAFLPLLVICLLPKAHFWGKCLICWLGFSSPFQSAWVRLALAPDTSLLLTQTLGSTGNVSSNWISTTSIQKPGFSSWSSLPPNPAPAVAGILGNELVIATSQPGSVSIVCLSGKNWNTE